MTGVSGSYKLDGLIILHLLGGLEQFLFFHLLRITIPTDELIFFRGVGQPPTRHTPFINEWISFSSLIPLWNKQGGAP